MLVEGPGFVDLQVNGLDHDDLWAADPAAWRRAGNSLLRSGVTTYLPTLVSAPLDAYDAALDRVAAAREDARARGLPRIEGVHLEGPFLGAAPGAHPVELLRTMDLDWLTGLLDRHPGLVRVVTLAPEADPGLEGTRELVRRGVLVALGHTRCTYDEAVEAAEAGARLVTHLFNGMAPLHHRQPGLVGAALDDRVALTPTVVADLVHVHPSVLRTVVARHEAIVVTDRVATGVDHHGQVVAARDGAAYRADGTLAGSTLTMEAAARNLHDLGLPVEVVFDALAGRAAAVLGFAPERDRVALDPRTLAVVAVWLAGEPAYAA